MRRALLYSVTAAILGLSLVLVPSIALAEIKAKTQTAVGYALHAAVKELEGRYLHAPRPQIIGVPEQAEALVNIEFLTISFIVALAVYALSKRRIHYRSHKLISPHPF